MRMKSCGIMGFKDESREKIFVLSQGESFLLKLIEIFFECLIEDSNKSLLLDYGSNLTSDLATISLF